VRQARQVKHYFLEPLRLCLDMGRPGCNICLGSAPCNVYLQFRVPALTFVFES
jgi:hypothetical protein